MLFCTTGWGDFVKGPQGVEYGPYRTETVWFGTHDRGPEYPVVLAVTPAGRAALFLMGFENYGLATYFDAV
jgi:hypothetical protein